MRPFSLEDTRNYIRYHLQRAEAAPQLFSDPASQRIFQSSRGIPRHINQICLYLLIQAAVMGLDEVDGDFAANEIKTHLLYQNPQQ